MVFGLLVLMIVMDGALFLHLNAAYRGDNLELFHRSAFPSGVAPPPDGYTSSDPEGLVTVQSGHGWAIRYASRGCQYCQEDELLWNPLKSKLYGLGYKIIVLVPSAKDEFPANSPSLSGVQQESFVNIAWIRQFQLTVTPTLLIFDSRGRLIWLRQGMLAAGDPISALRAVKSSMDNIK